MAYDPVEIFKALSNPSRLEILRAVYRMGICGNFDGERPSWEKCSCVGDIVEQFKLAPSTISHHAKELSRAGLIKVSKEGQFVRIVPNPEALQVVDEFIKSLLAEIKKT